MLLNIASAFSRTRSGKKQQIDRNLYKVCPCKTSEPLGFRVVQPPALKSTGASKYRILTHNLEPKPVAAAERFAFSDFYLERLGPVAVLPANPVA